MGQTDEDSHAGETSGEEWAEMSDTYIPTSLNEMITDLGTEIPDTLF